MKYRLSLLLVTFLFCAHAQGQEPVVASAGTSKPQASAVAAPEDQPLPPPKSQKRSWFSRILHPFGSPKRTAPEYRDQRLRGLVLDLQISPAVIKLSEVRQLEVRVTVTDLGKRAVELDFPDDQRIEILLRDGAGTVLTRWSDNHAVSPKPGTLLINPGEHIEYNETIATRELTPNKVFTLEVFFPKYPELRIRQKFLTAP
ncbi:MAG: BsuPI-related putative proteinase inhibitor [Chthoniobacterales bacterium]